MKRLLRHLLIAFTLLFAQQVAQLHAFSHVGFAYQAGDEGNAPSAPHPAAKCLAFHAVDSVLPCGAIALDPPRITPAAPRPVALLPTRSPRIEFDSRAPPSLS